MTASQPTGPIPITAETDRIYKKVPRSVTVSGLAGPQTVGKLKIEASSKTHDCVLWNPWIAKSTKMGDFGDEEYHTMVCVEPGYVSGPLSLGPGETFSLFQEFDTTPSAAL